MRRPAFYSLIQRRTSASRAVTLRRAKRRNLRVVSSANQRSTRFSRDEVSDLQARPVYHRKRDSVVTRLTIVCAALAATRPIEARTGGSIRNSSRPPAAAAPSRPELGQFSAYLNAGECGQALRGGGRAGDPRR